jgi:hypothetical protein
MKSNFTVHQDHLHANNLLKRNRRRKEQELEATKKNYIVTMRKMKLLYKYEMGDPISKALWEACKSSLESARISLIKVRE